MKPRFSLYQYFNKRFYHKFAIIPYWKHPQWIQYAFLEFSKQYELPPIRRYFC